MSALRTILVTVIRQPALRTAIVRRGNTSGTEVSMALAEVTTSGYTAGHMLRIAAGVGLEGRTTAQVLADIGAAATGHTHAQLHDAATVNGNGITIVGQQISLSIGTGATQVAAGEHSHSLDSLGAAPRAISITTESTTARTISSADYETKIRCTHASGCVLTLNTGTGIAGRIIIVRRATGAGAVSFAGTATVNNSGVASITAGQEFALMAVDANTFDFV